MFKIKTWREKVALDNGLSIEDLSIEKHGDVTVDHNTKRNKNRNGKDTRQTRRNTR